jgi:hypothetical protein
MTATAEEGDVLIPVVEQGVEALLRAALPLRKELGDVSFDAPTGSWSAQLSRITVDLFLFGLSRSSQPARPTPARTGQDGRAERRHPLPMVELNYLVSTYAGTTRDEHQLLSDVFTCFIVNPALPAEFLPRPLDCTVQLTVAPQDHGRAKDVWSGVGGTLRSSFELVVTAALEGLPWEAVPPRVERIEALAAPIPNRPIPNGRG